MASIENKLIKNFFNKEELTLLQKYCDNKLYHNQDYIIESHELTFSPSWNRDTLMNAILDIKAPLVEKEINLKLLPTYAYWRYYVFGATLEKHWDRPACEISLSVCVKKYDKWPLIVEKKSFELEEGDALLYAGTEQMHYRPGVYKGKGIAQIFLHYVNKNGSFVHHQYDNFMKTTGLKESNNDKEILRRIRGRPCT